MPHGLMQQNARPTRSQHHLHLARRRCHRAQLQNRAARRLLRQMLWTLAALELIESSSAAAARRALRGARFVLGDDKHIQPAQRLRVAGKGAVAGGNQNAPQLLAVAGAHLHNARVVGACGAVGTQNQFQPRGQVQVEPAQRHRIQVRALRFRKALHRLFGRSAGNQRRGTRGMQQPLGAQVVGVGIAGALAAQHPHPASRACSLTGRLHNLLVNAQRRRRYRFKVQIGVVASGRKRLAQAALQQPLGDAEFLKKIPLVTGVWGSHRGSSVR